MKRSQLIGCLAWAGAQVSLAAPLGKVIQLDMYRAMSFSQFGADMNFTNDDLATLEGVLNYLHTDVVGENVHANTNYAHSNPLLRTTRANNMDSIVKARFKVRNSDELIDKVGTKYNWVDFGPTNQFTKGKALARQDILKKYGDYVGVGRQIDKRYPSWTPLFWFSVSGFCPNLATAEKGTVDSPNKKCLKSPSGTGVLMGGRCPPGQEPTGEAGCVYSYDSPDFNDIVKLDDLVGITNEDCAGGKKCQNFKDFRKNCVNKEYRQKFDYAKGHAYRSDYTVCVEYDIAPACAIDCNSKACKEIPEDKREIGLPFWRGRCDPDANQQRTQKLKNAFGDLAALQGQKTVALDVSASFTSCAVGDVTRMCHPKPAEGGMYCTREWGGVCQGCFIPNTLKGYHNEGQDPPCPWNILTTPDYNPATTSYQTPYCKSQLPRDLCCLYSTGSNVSSCSTSIPSDPALAPLNDDGFWLQVQKQDTWALATFLTRYSKEVLGGNVVDTDGMNSLAFTIWGRGPSLNYNLATIRTSIKPLLDAWNPKTEAEPLPVIPGGTEPPASAEPTEPEPQPDEESNQADLSASPTWDRARKQVASVPSWVFYFAGGAVVLLVVAAGVTFYNRWHNSEDDYSEVTSSDSDSDQMEMAVSLKGARVIA